MRGASALQERPARLSDSQIASLKANASIVRVAAGGGIDWDLRKSRPGVGDYWALCPFHAEKTPSFHVVERGGQSFFKCMGCGEKGDAIALAQKLHSVGFREALRIAAGDIDVEPDPELIEARAQLMREMEAQREATRAKNRADAEAIYYAAGVHVSGTLGEHYLRQGRSIKVALGGAELRFHSRAPLSPYDPPKAGRCPAIVAPIRDAAGEHFGTHLTFIEADGSGKRRFDHLGGDARMICGGHVGGFIRLGRVRDAAVIGEGIETTLSASEACGLPGLAAINAPNMRALVLPGNVRRVVIAFDRDPKGVGELSAEVLAERLWTEGRTVEMLPPPEGFKDWNDAAQAGAATEAHRG